jgi:hypothetical protein
MWQIAQPSMPAASTQVVLQPPQADRVHFLAAGGMAKGHHDGASFWKLCCFPSLILEESSRVDIDMDILSYPSSIAQMELPHFGQDPR